MIFMLFLLYIGLPQFTAFLLFFLRISLVLHVHFWGGVRNVLCTLLSAAEASEQSLQVCEDQKSTMNESSSAGAGESTWSSGQQMKMENCYHLWVLFKYMQAREAVRSWWMPRVPAVVDMINEIPGPPPHPLPVLPVHHHNRQTDVCRSPTSTENCPCAKLPLGWEILFICCTSPIMFLSPSRLWVLFIKIAGVLTYFSVQQLNKSRLPTCLHLPRRERKKYKLKVHVQYKWAKKRKKKYLQLYKVDKESLSYQSIREAPWVWSYVKSLKQQNVVKMRRLYIS